MAIALSASIARGSDLRFVPDLPSPYERIWPSDSWWTRDFAVPGIDGTPNVLEVLGNDLYIGGWFTQADDVELPGLARFDGSRWQPSSVAGDPVPSAMLTDGTSMLIAGNFVDRQTRARWAVTRWTRDAMSPVGGDDMRGPIVRLFRWNGSLVAAGTLRFNDPSGDRHALAQFTGSHWTPLGPPLAQVFDGVSDAVVFRGRIVVGGAFGGNDRRALLYLRADGSAFDTLLTDGATTSALVNKLEVHEDRLIAGGSFALAGDPEGLSHNLVAWDGATLSALDAEFGGWITALRSTPTGLLIGGQLYRMAPPPAEWFSVARLGPQGLQPFPGLRWTEVRSLVEWRGHVVAGGRRFALPPGVTESSPGLAIFDGNEWHPLGRQDGDVAGLDSYYGIPGFANTRTFLAAGGEWFAAGRIDLGWSSGEWRRTGPVVRWANDHWESFGTGWLNGDASAIAWNDGVLYAAGNFEVQTPNGFVGATMVRSDGGPWAPVPDAPPGQVTSLAVYGGRVIACGLFAYAGTGLSVMGIAAFDGTTWTTVGDAVAPANDYFMMSALLVHDGSLYAAGEFSSIAGVPARSIARWDGVSWSPLGAGYGGQITALGVHNGDLVAAGFCNGQADCSSRLETWDGISWTPIPNAPPNVTTMASARGILFVGGQFSGTDQTLGPDSRLRAWDGRAWHALGSGLERDVEPYTTVGIVSALGIRNDVLWVGGSFRRAGGKTALSVATWTGLTGQPHAASRFDLDILATPNPSRPGKDIDFAIAGDAPAEVGIYDVSGRRLHTLRTAPGAGGASATWNGRDADGKPVPAGIYFARATREGRVIATKRLVRLP